MRVPNSPFDNPILTDGIYAATVVSVTEGTYGDNHDPLVMVLLELEDGGPFFRTNFYFPKERLTRAMQRLSHFCAVIDAVVSDVQEEPSALAGRKLRLEITTTKQPSVNYGRPYCDVRYFLPYETEVPVAS